MVSQTYLLHQIPVTFHAGDAFLADRLDVYWRAFRADDVGRAQPIQVHLHVTDAPPQPPDADPFSAGPEVSYYRTAETLTVFFPAGGRFDMALEGDTIRGWMARDAADAYGVFEDMILIALKPMLRRRGYYTIHAFAAAVGDRSLLILGESGAGKTTTGLSLLARGARLLANDAPLLHLDAKTRLLLHAYPGLISAYPDSLARFAELTPLLRDIPPDKRGKIAFAVEDVWPGAWAWQAQPAALVFPHITPGLTESSLEPMTAFGALQRLIGQSIEDWDEPTIPAQLRMLRHLVSVAPAYYLHLAPDIPALPDLLLPLVE